MARFGGDEFALVCRTLAATALFSSASASAKRSPPGSFLRAYGLKISLTVSVGVATLPDVAASAEQLIQAADEAMYAVKDGGKNGIQVAGA